MRYKFWLVGILLAAGFQASTAADSAATLELADAYAWAMPPGQTNSAAFLRIRNLDTQDHAMLGVRNPRVKVIELHTHRMETGVARMRRVERIELPAGSAVELQPGGLHLMLIGLDQPLAVGEQLLLTLSFEDGSEKSVAASVRSFQPMAAHH
jgi:copper(I)-binding protein